MNLKKDKDKIVEMLTSKDLELRKLAVDYIRNNYDIDIVVPFLEGLLYYSNFEPTQTAEWQLSFIRAGYNSEFIAENLVNAIIEHNKL